MTADERQARDRRTVEAIAQLYRKQDAEPPALFDDVPTTSSHNQIKRYVEIMGRLPLHADKDNVVLQQKPKRQR